MDTTRYVAQVGESRIEVSISTQAVQDHRKGEDFYILPSVLGAAFVDALRAAGIAFEDSEQTPAVHGYFDKLIVIDGPVYVEFVPAVAG